ncbi:EamA family transporter [Salinibius halmophilus]|uniref:EamA family transporter n=1 Tax=Salinibius halmophilus TaxID=1853216 RepID=UPI000E66A496|nr:EamA family transporter [Salinibius halmophilus]
MAKQTINLAITALVPIIWGSTYFVTTEFLPADVPLLAAMLRALPAGLVLLLIFRQLPSGSWWLKSLALGVLNIGAFFYFLFVAAYHLPGGIAALVMSVQPFIVLAYSALLFRNPIQANQVMACAMAVMGVGLVVVQQQTGMNFIGVAAGLAGALSMATGIVLTKRWGRPDNTHLLSFTAWQLVFGGLVLLPLTLWLEPLPTQLSGKNILGFAYLSIIGALVAYALWFRGIEKLASLSVSLLALLSPLSAALIGFIVLNQGFSPLQLCGALIIIAAIVLAQLPQRTRQPA